MHIDQLDELNRWFCNQRHLDDRLNERPEFTRLPESLGKVRSKIAGAGRTTIKAIGPSRMRNRKDGDTGEEPPGTHPLRLVI